MILSEVTVRDVASYLKLFATDLTSDEERELRAILSAAKQIVINTIGRTEEECDKFEELSIAVLILCQDMYDNRTRYTKASEASPNKTLEAILSLHDCNLL